MQNLDLKQRLQFLSAIAILHRKARIIRLFWALSK